MEKLKLFVDAHVFDGIHQGTVTFISGLYKEIVKNKDVQLFVGSENYEKARTLLNSSNFIHIRYKSHSKFRRLAIDIPYALYKNKIDYAHFQYIVPLIKTTKYIVTIHDLLFLDFPSKFPVIYRIKNTLLFYLSAKQANILTTVSDYSKKSIAKHFKITLTDIAVTPNAVEQVEIKAIEVDELSNKDFILFVSRIEPRKNQSLLLKAWIELKLYERNICLVLVGAVGILDSTLNNQIENLTDIQKQHFYWLKDVSKENLVWLYKNCRLFIFPSKAEGFGIPPIEAAYYGAKVACSNKTAMSDFDFFKDLSFSPDNIEEMKSKIIDGLNEEIDIEKIKEDIISKYNWHKIANNFINSILINEKNRNYWH
ncbi:MAG: glycosyltransferase family 1 protein [Paludibacteraceae bacterium]